MPSHSMKYFYAAIISLALSTASHATQASCEGALANVFGGKTIIEIIIHSDIKGPWQSGRIRDNQSIRGEITPERWGLGIDAPNGTPLGEIYQNGEISPQGNDEPGCSYKLERIKPGMHIIKLNGEIIGTMTGPIPKNDARIK